jgi:hypothetical protein
MIGLLVVVVGAAALAGQPATRCDRACLDGWLDRYMDAFVAHAPSRLPLARGVKFTENGQRLMPGDGTWRTVTGKGGYALKIADVGKGQAVLMGTIREADVPTIFVLRLGITGQQIAEIETLVMRNQMAAENIDRVGRPRAAWYEAVPAASRLARADLVKIANMYFTGIERNDGKGVYPISKNCARLENGSVTAGDPALVLGDAAASPTGNLATPQPRNLATPGGGGTRTGCLQQFQSGVFFYVTRIRDRRFVAVDPERGLAFAFAFFDNASGDTRNGTLADGRKVVSGPSVPWTWQIAEVFKIENGEIGPVESVLHQVPYGMGSGWSSWEETMSSTPRW